MDAASFERQRLSLFERYGLVAQSRWVVDGLGRRIYVAERVGTGRPVVLVHGGLSQGGDWCLMAGRLSGPVVIPDRPGWGLTYSIDHRRVNFREASAQWLGVVLDGLGLVSCPTLFLWGDADSFAPPALGQRVADTMPDARVQVVPDAGHSPHLDQPAIIAEAVETFTKKT